jgi:hypothetical protein
MASLVATKIDDATIAAADALPRLIASGHWEAAVQCVQVLHTLWEMA